MSATDFPLRRMEDVTFAQLRTFACAAGSGSFAKAAEQLYISQPAVSEQIRTLEERLGRHLFERRRGSTPLLTPEGEEALEIVQTILAASHDLFGRSRRSAKKIPLRISIGPFLRENYLGPLVPRIYREYPGVDLDLRPAMSSMEVMRQIHDGEIDLAIYTVSVTEEAPAHARQIRELPFAMLAPPGTRARLSAGQCSLDDFQYLFLGNGELEKRCARKLLRDLRLAPRRPPLFIPCIDALVRMIEDGQGIGHLMTYSVADKIAAGRIEPLDIPLVAMRRLIGRSPHAPAVAQEIEDVLCEALSV